jgi:hypothetical protein
MSAALKNNIIGLLLAPTEEFELIKLGHVIALASADGIDLQKEIEEYMELRELRSLGKQYLKGSPKWLAEASKKQFSVLSSVLAKIWKERPGILEAASEKVAEIDFAEILRGKKEAGENA